MTPENFSAQLLYQSELAELSFLPESGILWLSWKAKASSVIIQEVYEQLFRQMQSRQVKHVLLDVSRRGRATAADETWMMREFVPRLLQFFKEGIYLAYLLDASHYRALKAESPNGSLESLSHLLSMNYFREAGKAFTWLTTKNLRTAI
ncbi:hypothetical protein [Adhaeribacter rhizoryzae]|uniref:STAS/SEC14 domain-containing protein n=1 Tax=Adhaeribacter rhizoryzae TaxID=2607907 RepID=A0A5M6DAQ5_9BACT|nr:hypothetical protein [Adhaeribacter rhizoryzae]KAA5543382.1 hypothetical protein F0145_17225 [Adhaeribacter rhizoryzae]